MPTTMFNAVSSPNRASRTKKPCSATDPLWYKDAVIYELHVRAFADSDGDGVGDFQGLISKLDYLQDLGVTCIWLLPFFPSPGRDDGYDIADYMSVNPQYGTVADFQEFLNEAHARNMQVLIELVINHTSDQHPWFQAARHAPKGSPERDMYVWSDTEDLYRGVRIIFTDTEKSNWTWDDVAGQYFWHRFFSHQPDLNFDNPRVLEEVLNAMRFWMDMGVDGLRLDAIPYLVERDGTSCENVPETHVKIKEIRRVIDEEYENRMVLAEANMWPDDVRPYFGDGDECHMAFHFPLMPRIYMAVRQEDRLPITDIMAQTPEIPPVCQWGIFLRNHDELTLEMVTDDERDYMNMAYAADSRMRINVGIRRRLAPLLDNNRRRIELLNSLLFSMPGTPILYYGDEIGMGDNIYLGDRNGVRTPMQWNSDRNAGFSKAVPAKLYFPVIMDPIWGYQAINVEAQQSDPSSLLHWTRNMIALRKLFQVFGRGTLEFLHPDNRKVLAYVRDFTTDDGSHSETVLCVANLSRFAQPVALDLNKYAGRQPVEMLGYVPFPQISGQPGSALYPLTLAPYSFLWLELPPAAERIEPPLVETTVAPSAAESIEKDEVAAETFAVSRTSTLALPDAPSQAQIEDLLPGYIAQQRWFGGKSRSIAEARITSAMPIPGVNAVLTTVGVRFEDGGPAELYQLPLATATGDQAKAIQAEAPGAVLATLHTGDNPPVLYDATAGAGFRSALIQLIATSGELASTTLGSGDLDSGPGALGLTAERSAAFTPAEVLNSASRVGSAEQSNTSIIYGEQAILKLFRRLRSGENPDVEITRFLTETANFKNIPAYLGDLHLGADKTTIAFLQQFAPNQGDGWAWTIDELSRYYEGVANCPPPHDTGRYPTFTSSPALRDEAHEHAGLYLEAAALLGRRTGELHLALATPTENPAFTAENFTTADLDADRLRIGSQADNALAALHAKLTSESLSGSTAALADDLLAVRDELRARATNLSGDPATFGQRIRIHGDFHLGQLLRSSNDFLIVDFEGEPARSLEERRRKQSPLRDVAGMLRSFSYAARSAMDRHAARRPDQAAALKPWATLWENSVASEYLRGYREAAGAATGLLPQGAQANTLLSALLLEKALYELLYELNNRPTWLHIPITGLLALAR